MGGHQVASLAMVVWRDEVFLPLKDSIIPSLRAMIMRHRRKEDVDYSLYDALPCHEPYLLPPPANVLSERSLILYSSMGECSIGETTKCLITIGFTMANQDSVCLDIFDNHFVKVKFGGSRRADFREGYVISEKFPV